MRTLLPAQVLGLLLSSCMAFTSQAEFHATLTATTNNYSRWYSKNDNSVGVQGNVDYQYKWGWYLGGNLATVDLNTYSLQNAANVELVPYLGWGFNWADEWRMEVQWSRYLYDGKVFGNSSADYNEFYLFGHYRDILTAQVSFAENFYGLGDYALNYELTGRYPISDSWEMSASFGYGQTAVLLGSDYPYWNAGFSYFYKFLAFDLRYVGAAEILFDHRLSDQMHENYDPPLLKSTVVFSISVGF